MEDAAVDVIDDYSVHLRAKGQEQMAHQIMRERHLVAHAVGRRNQSPVRIVVVPQRADAERIHDVAEIVTLRVREARLVQIRLGRRHPSGDERGEPLAQVDADQHLRRDVARK